ncbi:hypothetical protein DMA12_15230 [Amycolatopsis balhimycina DSM 5908]|uniref:Uncharacterized protein n=1 Tax=Amycolatopsis balhimycina DSM 5908 TaxID=1081091 RepID=A0A428WPB4_AMYBA|nr:hypothetical protein [Amycolatopsis balhimycina]RSM44893.1 hypothetical protein DMA12_15230 [Amycolatopsis balhimycina DSM 5908]
MPAFFVGFGVVSLVASLVGGRLVLGLWTAGAMVVCAVTVATLPAPRPPAGRSGSASGVRTTLGVLAAVVVVVVLATFVGSLAAGGTGYLYFALVMALAVLYVGYAAVARRR